jgi:sn-glycerol 3-phosphate transport system permease protein
MATDVRATRPVVAPRTIGRYALLTFCAVVVFLPIYVAVVLAIQPAARVVDFPGVLLPKSLTLTPLRNAFRVGHLWRYLLNSAIVTVVIVGGQVVTSVLAAYAFAFVQFPFKRVVFTLFLATLMVPAEATIVANYETIQHFGWLDSYQALIVPFLATAFGTFLIRQAFLGVPRDLRDATALDGYGHWGFLRHVAVPLARPAIAAFTVFSFLLSWNQYLWPLLVTNEDAHRTVQIGLKSLVGQNVANLNLPAAGAVIAGLPIFFLLLFFQRHLVRGLTSGAVKG